MDLLRLFSNRLLRACGLLVKIFSYGFHSFFKNKRFEIPASSKPLLASKSESTIPKILWQTNFTEKVSLPVYCNYLINRLMAFDYEYRFVSHENRLEMIKTYGSETELEAFLKLKDGAAQADFWRIFVLNNNGGVYLDIDGLLVFPLRKIIKKKDEELFIKPRRDKYTNYFLASKEKNPVLKKAMEIIIRNINQNHIDKIEEKTKNVYSITGPSALIEAIGDKKVNKKLYKYVCAQGVFTNEYFQYIDKPNGKWIHAGQDDIFNC